MRHVRSLILAASLCVCSLHARTGAAQIFPVPTDLSSAELQLIDSAGAAHLENARQLLEQKEWDEAVEAIRRVLENDGGRLIRVGRDPNQPAWHVTVREY